MVTPVALNNIRQILSDTDPRKGIREIIRETNKIIQKIMEQIAKVKFEEKLKLEKLQEDITEVQNLVKAGKIDEAKQLLSKILKSPEMALLDPAERSELEKVFKFAKAMEDELWEKKNRTIGLV